MIDFSIMMRCLLYFTAFSLPCSAFLSSRLFLQRCNQQVCGTNAHAQVDVSLGDRSYPIYIDNDLLHRPSLFKEHISSKRALIVTNTKVGPLYLDHVRSTLQKANVEVFEVVLPDGEEYKDMSTLLLILDAALRHQLDRGSIFLALGGGVIGDMTGFAAAIFQRGVRFVQLPTSLMAMVDSAVGGKTAVNHPLGKNMIGAFHQPIAVLADLTTLDTLPQREFISGLSEVVKYGLIHDPAFFTYVEDNVDAILKRDLLVLQYIVQRSCAIKAQIVALDEKEDSASGTRALLNLGHTFGHAVEASFGYGTWLHGEAVSVGTVMAAEFSARMGRIEYSVVQRIVSLFARLNLPVTLHNPHLSAQQRKLPNAATFLHLMQGDKKVEQGQLRLVLLRGPLGGAELTAHFDSDALIEVVREFTSEAK